MTQKATRTEMMQRVVYELLKGVGTSIPGYVQSFDAETQQATVIPGVQRVDIEGNTYNLPPIIKVPVMFAGGDWCVEYQIDEGNEGLIIVSQRCVDAWKDQGGQAPNPIRRIHDMQDGLFIPGFRSQANKLSNFANDGIRIRDKEAENYVWLKGSGAIEMKCKDFTVDSDGDTQINTNNFDVASGSMTHNGTNVGYDHDHDDTGTYNVSGTPVVGTSGIPT